jgi:hypothetical protein
MTAQKYGSLLKINKTKTANPKFDFTVNLQCTRYCLYFRYSDIMNFILMTYRVFSHKKKLLIYEKKLKPIHNR